MLLLQIGFIFAVKTYTRSNFEFFFYRVNYLILLQAPGL